MKGGWAVPSIPGEAYPAGEVAPQLLGLGGPEAKPDSTSWLGGLMLRVPSSRMHRPARDGFANVEIKGPSDWKAAWRTWNQSTLCRPAAGIRSDTRQAQRPLTSGLLLPNHLLKAK